MCKSPPDPDHQHSTSQVGAIQSVSRAASYFCFKSASSSFLFSNTFLKKSGRSFCISSGSLQTLKSKYASHGMTSSTEDSLLYFASSPPYNEDKKCRICCIFLSLLSLYQTCLWASALLSVLLWLIWTFVYSLREPRRCKCKTLPLADKSFKSPPGRAGWAYIKTSWKAQLSISAKESILDLRKTRPKS